MSFYAQNRRYTEGRMSAIAREAYSGHHKGSGMRGARARLIRRYGYVQPTTGALSRASRLSYARVPVENKFLDMSRVAIALTEPSNATGGEVSPTTLLCLNAMAQGDTASSRDGHVIVMTSIHITGVIKQAPIDSVAIGEESPKGVVYLVMDTQTNGAQLDSENVFHNQGATVALCDHPVRDLTFGRRFVILKKWRFNFAGKEVYTGEDATSTTVNRIGSSIGFEMHRKFRIPVRYNDGSATVASIVDNSLHLISWCAGQNQTTLSYNARLRFVG